MRLGRYQKLVFDIETAAHDLMLTPYMQKVETKPNSDTAELTTAFIPLHRINRWSESSVFDYLNRKREEQALLPFPHSAEIRHGSGYYNGPNHSEVAFWIWFPWPDYCAQRKWTIAVETDYSDVPKIDPKPSMLCDMGLHRYESEPIIQDFVKYDDSGFFLRSSGMQKGVARCIRCGKQKTVYRQSNERYRGGTVAVQARRWRRCSKAKEEYIDSLPIW